MVELNYEIAAKSGGLTCSSVKAMDGITADEEIVFRVDAQRPLPGPAVAADNDPGWASTREAKPEKAAPYAASHRSLDRVVLQQDGVEVRMSLLVLMEESGRGSRTHGSRARHQT
jgi:hypothetical protein